MICDTVTIRCGDWEAAVCPRLGGNIISLTDRGQNVLRPLTDEAQLAQDPFLQGAPIVMPANRTFGSAFVFDGKRYELPCNEPTSNAHLHGRVYLQHFETVAVRPDSVTVCFTDRDAASYPFPYALHITYTLTETGLESVYALQNLWEGDFPFTFAPHITFTEPTSFAVPIDAKQKRAKDRTLTDEYLPLDAGEQLFCSGAPSRGNPISGFYRACGQTARVGDYLLTASAHFDHWVLYNRGGNSELLCVEPQVGAVNGLNLPTGHRILKKGETLCMTTQITRTR